MALTQGQKELAAKLRDQNLSYARIAKAIGDGTTEAQVYKHPRIPPPKKIKILPPPPPPKKLFLPDRSLRTSTPTRKLNFNPDIFRFSHGYIL
jgi:hypothetical protein